MYSVYILRNSQGTYYVGYTSNLQERIARHNNGRSEFTSRYNEWELAHEEQFKSKSEAIKREKFIKSRKSRKFVDSLINIAG